MTKKKNVILTEKKLLAMSVCRSGMRTFLRALKGKKRLYLNEKRLAQYGRRGGKHGIWLASRFQLSGEFLVGRHKRKLLFSDGVMLGSRNADGSGFIALPDTSFYFRPSGLFRLDSRADTADTVMPESFDDAFKVATKLRARALGTS